MASVEDLKQELAKAEAEKQKAEAAVTAFEARYKPRLTWLEDKLWKEEGNATQQEKWEKEKTRLEERQKSLEAEKTKWSNEVVKSREELREARSQTGKDLVTL